jgi:hypothetical protein
MKFTDEQLKRLLKSAVTSPAPDELIPPPLQTRILARWKAGGSNGDASDLLRLFRIGFAMACVLLVLAAAFTVYEVKRAPGEELAMPNVVLNLAFSR